MPDDAPFDATGFSLILHYDPQMVAELAMGADHPHDIAERYGVDEVAYEHLAAQDWFQRLVAQKRHEYHDTGVLFTAKAAMMAESLLTRLFQQSMVGAIAAPLTVEVAKQLTEIGRLKPQPINTLPTPGGGNGFQINIQVNGSDVVAKANPLVPAPLSDTASPDAASMRDVTPPTLVFDIPSPPAASQGGRAGAAGPLPPTGGPAAAPTSGALPEPPAYISNLRVRDFDLRPNGAFASLAGNPAAQAAAAAVPTQPPSPGLPPTPGLR